MNAFKSLINPALLTFAYCLGLAHAASAQAPVLTIAPGNLQFSYTSGGTVPAAQTVTVSTASSTGSATVNSASISYSVGGPSGWLLVPTPNGIVAPGTSDSFPVYLVGASSLAPGAYSAVITLSYSGADPSSTTSFAVLLSVLPTGTSGGGSFTETITVSPTSLSFSYSPGSGVPPSQTVSVTVNDGASFTVAGVTNDGNPWLQASLASAANTVNVAVSPASLSPGSYSGTVTITAPSAVAQVAVALTVSAVGFTLNQTQLSFTLPQNYGLGAPQTIQVTSSPSTTVNASGTSDYGWLIVGTTSVQTPGAISVLANDSSLAQGSYQGVVTVQSAASTAVSIPVSLTVGPPATLSLAPGSINFSYTMGSPVPASQVSIVKSLTGSAQTFTVAASTNDGAAWLLATASSPTPGQVNVSVNPQVVLPGYYSGVVNVTPSTAGASPEPIAVSLTVLPAPTPVIRSVVSSASYGGSAIAPGEFVTLFGSTLGPATLATPPAGTFPTSLGGTSVSITGILAPILYASATQTTVQVPYGIPIGQNVVSVTTNGANSALFPVTSVPAYPGFFTANFSGTGQVAALNQDYSLNSASNPAARGSVIILYGTGEGVTVPASVEGTLTTTVKPIPQTQLPVTVSFQGINATLQYYGETPGTVSGLMQINAVVPSNAPTGAAVPVVMSINGQNSPTGTTVAIK